ncbi:MAG: hypothetical protein UV60_C0004G0031 [Parcubacteria group bacterium GW2011_GWA2_43_11]|nr:MAG: hypothetical protein UU89_C0013G0006 [Parcubacteria group bacterium GW2011_GWC2_42_11]KKS85954.1 MAG: hypothetical protein UV60_C0004G0031 [Parcubacteria group bacterium GW2011_GWA2_43_11]
MKQKEYLELEKRTFEILRRRVLTGEFKFKKIFLFLCFVMGGFVFGVGEASAEGIYISNAGAGDGSSCGQARSVSWFNASANWGSGDNKISDNDTVYLCGTITSSSLRMVAYGSVGNPYTITSAPGQTAIIDGQNILDRGISAYSSGSGEVILSNLEIRNIAGTGIEARPGVTMKIDNVTVRNVSQNCIGLSGNGSYVKNSTLIGCKNNGINGAMLSNGLIDNNIITLSGTYNDGITLHDGTGSNNVISNNTVSGVIEENAIDILPGYSNTTIFGNDLSGATLYVIGSGGANTIIYRNYIHDSARGVYLAAPASVYYNKLVNLSDDTYGSVGGTGGLYFTTADSSFVYNNTLVEGTQATGRAMVYIDSGVDNVKLKNNIFDENKLQTTMYTLDNPSIGLQSDYNNFNTPHTRLVQNASTVYANLTAWKNAGYDAKSMYGEQLFSNFSARNFNLLPGSPLIDAGTSVGLTTDFAGNPIYGTPDIGAYEYQPPHTIGTSKIDIGAGARIYGNGKFRDIGATNSNLADLTITPQSGNFQSFDTDEVRPEWLDVKNITWEATTKQWTESSNNSTLTNTLHTVGDLEANKYYNVRVDGTLGLKITGTNCTGGICKANSNGKIAFTYTGTYGEHTFRVEYAYTAIPIPTDTTAPSVPSLTATAVSSSQINLSWTASTDNVGVTGYKVYRNGTYLTTTTSTSHNSTGLTASTAYSYRVSAVDAAGNESSQSVAKSATTHAGTVETDATPPAVPLNLITLAVSSSQINLAWTASTDNVGVTGYKVYRNGTYLTTTTSASYINTGLTASTAYSYRVSAIDAAGNESSQSTAKSATTQAGTGGTDTTPPAAPTGFTAVSASA